APGLIEQCARVFVLVLECEVRDVARDHEMIRVSGSGGEHGEQIVATVHAPASQNEIRVARDAFIENDTAPFGSSPREDVQIRDMGDAKRLTCGVSCRVHNSKSTENTGEE